MINELHAVNENKSVHFSLKCSAKVLINSIKSFVMNFKDKFKTVFCFTVAQKFGSGCKMPVYMEAILT